MKKFIIILIGLFVATNYGFCQEGTEGSESGK